ncbi:MAG: polysaccharide biosynthesis C-terminal domain-containing protein, partial [Phycisphaerae bacterium]|nr:polysaccharide biosynthesis C-terminal domain-containing protein [Phycisphaerae bacterium]
QCTFLFFSLAVFPLLCFVFRGAIKWFAAISATDIVYIALGYTGLSLKLFFGTLFMGMGQKIKNALIEVVFGVSSVLLIIVFWRLDWINLRSVLLIYLLSAIVVIIISIFMLDIKLLLPIQFDRKHFLEMFHSIKWLIFGAFSVYLVNSGDNFVLRFFVPLDKIGVYNFAYQFFKGVLALVFILGNYFLPFISENIENSEKMREFYYKKRPKIFILAFAAIGSVFALGPYLINQIYQNSYQGWVPVFRILLAGAVFVLYFSLQCPILKALKKYRLISIMAIVQVVINIGLDVILVWRIGILGTAIATTFACLCSTVIMEIYFRRNLKAILFL